MENRLVELETRVAFQEHSLHELNAVVARQQREILALQRELETVRARLRELAAAPVAGPAEEPPPPHY